MHCMLVKSKVICYFENCLFLNELLQKKKTNEYAIVFESPYKLLDVHHASPTANLGHRNGNH